MKAPLTLTWPKGNPPKKYKTGDEITRPITDGQGLTLTFVGCKGVVRETLSDRSGAFILRLDSVPVSVRRKPLSQTDGAREIIADLCEALDRIRNYRSEGLSTEINRKIERAAEVSLRAGRKYLRTKGRK